MILPLQAPTVVILVLFTFGTSIFYVLLAIERRVWGLVSMSGSERADEGDVRFVHRILRHLIPVLPPSNGIVVVGGLAALVWQGVLRGWDWRALAVLGFYLAGQLYIILVVRIAAAVTDVWRTPSDSPYLAVSRGVGNLVRQHRNGLIHAAGVLALELTLIVAADSTGQ